MSKAIEIAVKGGDPVNDRIIAFVLSDKAACVAAPSDPAAPSTADYQDACDNRAAAAVALIASLSVFVRGAR